MEKELSNETLSDEEYELIRTYGGNIEHFWKQLATEITGEEYVSESEFSADMIVDIATDFTNQTVLEIGSFLEGTGRSCLRSRSGRPGRSSPFVLEGRALWRAPAILGEKRRNRLVTAHFHLRYRGSGSEGKMDVVLPAHRCCEVEL